MLLDHSGRLHPHHAHGQGNAPRARLALAVVCLCAFTTAVDITIVDVALPFIADDLHASTSDLQWVVDAYNIALAGLLLLGGGLADRFGRRRVFLSGYVLFGVGCLLASFSSSVGALVGARAIMGIGAAGVIAPALAILSVLYPPERRASAVAAWAIFGAAGLAVGPIAGGFLLDNFWWGSVFLVNVPFVAVGVVVGLLAIPESRKPGRVRLDLIGAALSVAGLGILLAGVIEGPERGWTNPFVLASLAVGLALAISFVVWELRSPAPMFDVRILLRRAVAAGAAALAVAYVCFTGMLFLVPQYLQYVQDREIIAIGLALVPFALAFSALSFFAPRMVARLGGRTTLVTGLVLLAVGNVILAFLPEASGWWLVLAGTVVLGFGLSFLIAPASTIVMNDLPLEKAGDGSSLNMLARFAAAAFGVALLGSVFASVYASEVEPATHGLPASQAEAVEQTVADVADVAKTLSPARAQSLTAAADDAFDAGAQASFALAAALSILTALASYLALRHWSAPQAPPPRDRAGPPDPAGA